MSEEIEEKEVVTEAPVEAEKLSIRDELTNAIESTKEPKETLEKPDKEAKVKAEKPRAEDGKFTKGVSQETKVEVLPEIKMPKSFPADKAKDFAALPRPIQELLAKREDDTHKELTKHDEERVFARQIREMATPYLPVIRAEGGDIQKAFSSFLNTAYTLRTASPQAKGQLLLQLANEFGADLRGASQAQPQVNPALQSIQQELAALKGQMQRDVELKKQQEDEALQSQIDAFSSDPEHIHFETVRADMAALLKGGVAKDLKDAYDRAVYANPQTRSTLLQQQVLSAEEQRVADKKAKAEAAKKAGSSIKGAPGMGAVKNGKIIQPDLRLAIRTAMAEHRGEA